MMLKRFIFSAIFCFSLLNIHGQFTIELEEFASGFSLPVDFVHDGTELMYVVEKAGVIKIVFPDGQVASEPFLDIRDRVDSGGSELGLLGLAFHPNYASNGQFYVNYTDRVGLTTISRFFRDDMDPMKADPNSEDRMLRYTQPFNNHNGGDLEIGPDGYLYIASGDGGSANDPLNNGQDVNSYLGKILRIDVDTTESYKIPPSNPFVGRLGLDEIWAFGLRNPWRFSFDTETGDFWIGDVGQNTWEEIDFQPADSPGGENYGWKCYEGNNPFRTGDCNLNQNFTFPIFEYNNNRFQEGCSVTGGYVYRGSQFDVMNGWYIYCDYCSGKFWGLRSSDTTNIDLGSFGNNEFGAFGQDIQGELYVMALRRGTIYKIVVPCSLEADLTAEAVQCPGDANGSVSVTTNDTTSRFEWSTGDTTQTVDDLGAGWYTVTITSIECEIVDSVEVETPMLTSSCLINTDTLVEICAGEGYLLEACTAPGGYDYVWLRDGEVVPDSTGLEFNVNESGTYQVVFAGICPLDTSDAIEVVVKPAPETPTITQNEDTLFANITATSYDWFLDGVFLASSGDPFLVASISGNYQVRGQLEGCRGDLSSNYNFIVSSSDDLALSDIKVLPNPFQNFMELTNHYGLPIQVDIYDLNGKKVFFAIESGTFRINTSNWPNGAYQVQINSDRGSKRFIVVK